MAHSGGLTTAELVAQVKANLGNRTDKTDGDIVGWLNLEQIRLARLNNFRELHKTIAVTITPLTSGTNYKTTNQKPGSNSEDVPSEAISYGGGGLKAMESVRVSFGDAAPYDRSYMLSYLGRRQFHRLIPNAESSLAREGYSTVFTEENEQIYLYKIPNKKYLLEVGYWSWPTAMTTTSTSSDYDGKDDILIAMATSMGFHSLGMREQGIQYYSIGNVLIQNAIQSDEDKPSHVITGRGTSSVSGNLMGEPWNDPFVQGIG